MSLKEDLARNRAVFERLTGSSAEPEAPRARFDYDAPPPREAVNNATFPAIQSFSLSSAHPREYKRETGMALGYEAPAGIEYPALRENTGAAVSDPLDSLYHRLAVEARQSSQLYGEEDF